MAKNAGLFSNKAKTAKGKGTAATVPTATPAAKERTLAVNKTPKVPPAPKVAPIQVPDSKKKFFLKKMTLANNLAEQSQQLAQQSQQLAQQSQQLQAQSIENKTKAFAGLEMILEEHGFDNPESWSYNDQTGVLTYIGK